MTQADIDRIKDYCAKATEGPWDEWEGDIVAEQPDGLNHLFKVWNARQNDRQFIVAARTDLPAAIAEIERLNQAMAGLKEDVYKECADYVLALHLEQCPKVGAIDALKAAYDHFTSLASTVGRQPCPCTMNNKQPSPRCPICLGSGQN